MFGIPSIIALPGLYTIIGALVGLLGWFLLIVGYFGITNNAPDALTHWKAAREGKPICRVHFRGKKARDYIATIDKDEKDMGTNYWTCPEVGPKFKPDSDDIEFIEGSIPCVNHYEHSPEGQNVKMVAAFSQLKKYFKKKGFPIDGFEQDALFIAQEYEKTKDAARAIENMHLEKKDVNTQQKLKEFIDFIEHNRHEIENQMLESGIFTWQVAMKALDESIAYTSSHIQHTKEVIQAAAKRKDADKTKNLMLYAAVAFIFCIGAAAFLLAIK